MNTNAIPYLDKVLQLNDTLLGLPALPLVFVGCLVLGYMLKAIPVVSNRWIPAGVFAFGVGAYLIITPLHGKVDAGRAIIMGMVAGAASWVAHRKWLKAVIDDKLFRPDGDTETISSSIARPGAGTADENAKTSSDKPTQ